MVLGSEDKINQCITKAILSLRNTNHFVHDNLLHNVSYNITYGEFLQIYFQRNIEECRSFFEYLSRRYQNTQDLIQSDILKGEAIEHVFKMAALKEFHYLPTRDIRYYNDTPWGKYPEDVDLIEKIFFRWCSTFVQSDWSGLDDYDPWSLPCVAVGRFRTDFNSCVMHHVCNLSLDMPMFL